MKNYVWIFIIVFLCIAIVCLLKWIADLKRQLGLRMEEEERLYTKMLSIVQSRGLLVHWIGQNIQPEDFAAYFRRQGIRRIAIYGMTEVGELLYQTLRGTDIEVVCGIDRSKQSELLPVTKPAGFQGDIDAMVVTPVYYFSEIYDTMRPKVGEKTPILGIDDILFELSCYPNAAD